MNMVNNDANSADVALPKTMQNVPGTRTLSVSSFFHPKTLRTIPTPPPPPPTVNAKVYGHMDYGHA